MATGKSSFAQNAKIAGVPHVEDTSRLREAIKMIQRYCPLATRAFLSRKFALPKYREADYYNQDTINQISVMMLMLPTFPGFVQDDVVQSQMLNLFQALHCDRPTLFLERELGEILVKTEIPGFLETEDIHFPFPSIRIMLPKGLLGIASQNRWLMYIDIGHLSKDAEVGCPRPIALELDRYALNPNYPLSRMSFHYPEHALALSAQLDHGFASSYAMTKPLKGSIEAFKAYKGDLRTEFPNDDDDRLLLAGMEKLSLNILLILSMMPLEYEPLIIERKERKEGKRTIPSLARAKFVGDHLTRAKAKGHVRGEIPQAGRKLPAHWRCGAWKHQPHGKGFALRKLIYVMPYKTHGPDADV
jgi:hypothetical protein